MAHGERAAELGHTRREWGQWVGSFELPPPLAPDEKRRQRRRERRLVPRVIQEQMEA